MSTNRSAVLHRDELIARMMGNTEMAERMLQKFLDTGAADCDLMESTVRVGNKQAIASIAHRHKGAAQTMAAPRIAATAAELEKRAFSEPISELLALIEQIRAAHQEVREAARRGLAEVPLPSASDPA